MTLDAESLGFVLEKIDVSNWSALQKISRTTYFDTFAASNTEENMTEYLNESFSEDKLKSELESLYNSFFVAYSESREVIGYIKVISPEGQGHEFEGQNCLEVARCYVAKEYHGKSVGKLLFEKAMEIAKEQKREFVWLGVWEHNHKALAFYKKNGFEIVGSHGFQMGDDLQTDLLMKRLI